MAEALLFDTFAHPSPSSFAIFLIALAFQSVESYSLTGKFQCPTQSIEWAYLDCQLDFCLMAAIKEDHKRVAYKNRNSFLMVLKAYKFKIKALIDLGSDKGPLPGQWTTVLLPCPHVREEQGSFLGHFS